MIRRHDELAGYRGIMVAGTGGIVIYTLLYFAVRWVLLQP